MIAKKVNKQNKSSEKLLNVMKARPAVQITLIISKTCKMAMSLYGYMDFYMGLSCLLLLDIFSMQHCGALGIYLFT